MDRWQQGFEHECTDLRGSQVQPPLSEVENDRDRQTDRQTDRNTKREREI